MFSISFPQSSAAPGHSGDGRATADGDHADRGTWRALSGLRRRGRSAGKTWTCLGCGLAVGDLVAASVGFCPRCQDFTGLCGAGRRLISPDVMTWTSWHTPCTSRGTIAWQIGAGRNARAVLLCPVHDEQLKAGQAAWIEQASPLAG